MMTEIIKKRDYVKYMMIGMVGCGLLIHLFYNHILISVMGSVLGIFFVRYMKYHRYNQWRKDIKVQFKEGLYTLSSSIQVGKSIENAFQVAVDDLKLLYKDDAFIIVHFKKIVSKLSMSIPVEKALLEFAIEADDEDIYNFAVILISTKRAGGNMVEIISSSSQVIHDKLDVLDGIRVTIAQKRYEQQVMMLILPLMMVYMKINATDMMNVMYTTFMGRVVMTIALGLYIFSYYVGYKIMAIEV